jgi:transposase-like protein
VHIKQPFEKIDMYGMNIATGMISAVTDKLIPELKAWQQRPLDSHYPIVWLDAIHYKVLDSHYPIVWLDAIHYKVKEDGRYISKAVYTLLGLDIHGKKEIMGLHLSENEGANYWLSNVRIF